MTPLVRFKGPQDRLVFSDEEVSNGSEGEVAFGGVRESFLASHTLWSREAYEDDWARNGRRLGLGLDCFFVTNMEARTEGATIWVWPVFRHAERLLTTQLLIEAATRGTRFFTAGLAELIDFRDLRELVGSEVSFFEVSRQHA